MSISYFPIFAQCMLPSFVFVFCLIPVLKILAYKFSFIDIPDGVIKKHQSPIPPVGGIAIYGGMLIATPYFLSHHIPLFSMVGGLTSLLLVGCADDIFCLTPRQKFIGQIGATLFLIYSAFLLKTSLTYNIFFAPLALWWVASLTNAFNLIDIMDGLAATTALMAALGFLSIAFATWTESLIAMLSSFIGGLLAFIWYNRPQATIYLGDAGSLFIGGFLALVPFFIEWRAHTPWGIFCPFIILAIPALEIVSLIIIRSVRSIPFYKASPDHFALYLLHNGWTKQSILLFVIGMTIFCNTVAYCLFKGFISLPTVFALGTFFLCLWIRTVFAHLLFKHQSSWITHRTHS